MSIRILVVDDEREVLRLVQTILADSAWDVVLVAGADRAIRALQEMPAPPDLVLMDVVMPGMSGPMLADRLREIAPALRILFMSGFDHSQVVQQYVIRQGFDLIAKPFSPRELVAAIKKSLGSA